jgi:hypothetical protein
MIFPLEMGMSLLYGWLAFATTLSVFGRSVFDRPYLLLKFGLFSIEYSKSIFESVDITGFSAKFVPSIFKTALTAGY